MRWTVPAGSMPKQIVLVNNYRRDYAEHQERRCARLKPARGDVLSGVSEGTVQCEALRDTGERF